MAFIHTQPTNLILRSILRPFSPIIPKKYYFAIDGTIKIRLTEGKKLILHANPTSNLLRVLFWNGIKGFEPDEYPIFVGLVKKSTCFFDIGANLGYYSFVAKKFNQEINVHGFEPLTGVRKYFELNAQLNNLSDIHINEIAISDKNGTAKFYNKINPRFKGIKEQLYGDNSLIESKSDGTETVATEIKTQTLDSYVAEKLSPSLKIDLIKMDTEGTEHLVLFGAANVLEKHRPIIMCEIIHGVIENEISAIMNKNKYLFYRVDANGLQLHDKLLINGAKENYFFVPFEKKAMIEEFVR